VSLPPVFLRTLINLVFSTLISLYLAEKSEGIWARLIEKVVDNIQVRIEHVHIRYEDSTTDPLVAFWVSFWSKFPIYSYVFRSLFLSD